MYVSTQSARRSVLVLIFVSAFVSVMAQKGNYYIKESNIRFISNAPLERIEAVSTDLRGVIDPATKSFAFSVNNTSFKGFNSPLQREHFNENYVESDKHPQCTFTGKIIDDIDFSVNGVKSVRAKGVFTIRGVSKEKIIRSNVELKGGQLLVTSEFTVLLSDHDIKIPKVVYQKIAPEINIILKATLEREVKND